MVPANPPQKAVLMFLGKRQNVVLDEGWNFVPLYPLVFSFVLVKVGKVNYDLPPQKVRTPDRAVISVSESITWIAGIKDRPESFIAYLNSGGEEGVKKIIHDVIEDRTKTWAGSNKEGPSTWMEAQTVKDDAHEVLVKSILGDTLAPINSPVPTNTWMRFFDSPQSEPTAYDASPRNGWAEKDLNTGAWNWNGLQAIYDGYSPEAKLELKTKIDQRRADVRRIREGKGDFGDESLGITIVRFTVNEVKVEGEVAKAAELEEKERREREADTMEIDNISDRAAKLKTAHPELTSDQAFQIVQTERGKVGKTIIAVSGAKTDVGNDLLGLAGIIRETVKQFTNGGGSGSGSGSSKKKGGGKKSLSPKEIERLSETMSSEELAKLLLEEDEEDDDDENEKNKGK